MKKLTFDFAFILLSTMVLLAANHYGYLEKYMAFSLIPILIAYFLGQFAQRKFRTEHNDK